MSDRSGSGSGSEGGSVSGSGSGSDEELLYGVWEEFTDDASGKSYYHNVDTDETT